MAQDLMRRLSSTEWGTDQKNPTVIYKSLIRFKIDYGCIVYSFASIRELESLESVSNDGMKSTPISSLQGITEETPLMIRR